MKKDKERIENYVKFSLIFILLVWLFSFLETSLFPLALPLLWVAATIFNFVNSIRYLKCGGNTGLVILSLVVSSWLLLMFFIGFIYGIFIELGILL